MMFRNKQKRINYDTHIHTYAVHFVRFALPVPLFAEVLPVPGRVAFWVDGWRGGSRWL